MIKKKKICIVYWDLGLGGIQKRIRDLILYFSADAQHEVTLLLRRKSRDGFDDQIPRSASITVLYYPFNGDYRPPLGFALWIIWKFYIINPDVVLTFQVLLSSLMIFSKYLVFWRQVKVVLNEGAVTSRALHFEKLTVYTVCIRALYPLADKIIVPTAACLQDLVNTYSIPTNIISVIPNWTLFTPNRPLRSIYDVIYIGRFSEEKNPLFIITLAKKLRKLHKHIRIALIGNGVLQNIIEQHIRKFNLQDIVMIIPFSKDIHTIIRQSKIILLPSLNEGMPNVILESALYQIPSVISDFPGSDEVVLHAKTGYIYATEKQAYTYVSDLYKNELKRRKLGKAAQKFVHKRFGYSTQQRFINTLIT